MYCPKCGKKQEKDAAYCSECGAEITNKNIEIEDKGSIGWGILGFFFPLIGIILAVIWNEDQQYNSMALKRGAAIGFLVWIVVNMLKFVYMIAYPGFII